MNPAFDAATNGASAGSRFGAASRCISPAPGQGRAMPFLKRRIPAVFASACVVAAMSTGMASARMPGAEVFKPTQGMIYSLGSKRAIGYFVNQDGVCQLTLMIAEAVDPDIAQPPSAARMTVSMMPGQSKIGRAHV